MAQAKDLQIAEYDSFYAPYIAKVGDLELLETLRGSSSRLKEFMLDIPTHKHEHRYASGKWTIKEILLHLIDAERIFAYRALRFARNDKTQLHGFEENDYVPESFANTRTLQDLIEEYDKQRASTLALFANFSEEVLLRRGVANGNVMSVRALGFVIAGHETHHCEVIKERYL